MAVVFRIEAGVLTPGGLTELIVTRRDPESDNSPKTIVLEEAGQIVSAELGEPQSERYINELRRDDKAETVFEQNWIIHHQNGRKETSIFPHGVSRSRWVGLE